MPETVVDSSIIIDYLRGRSEATRFLDTLRSAGDLGTHVVVVAEVLGGARDGREQNAIERLFLEFRVLTVDGLDSTRSLELFRRYRLSHGVGWLDCLIAATCLRRGLPIATLNDRHFSVFHDLRAFRPY